MKRRQFLQSAAAGLAFSPAFAAAPGPDGPLDYQTFLALQRLDTPTVSNAIETFDVRPRNEGFLRPEIRSIYPEMGPMLGYAVTARIRAAERPAEQRDYVQRADWWDFIVSIPKPRVVVIEDLDDPPAAGSFWGEVNGSIHQALGCAGVVTNGGVRDLKEVRQMGFQFYAAHVVVSHAYVRMVEFGEPVEVGGVKIAPGDLVHADLHGVHTVPLQIAAKIPEAAREIYEREHRIIDYCHSGEFSLEGLKKLTGA